MYETYSDSLWEERFVIPEIEHPSPLRIGLGGFGWVRTSFANVKIGDLLVPRQMEARLPGANGQPSLTLFVEVIEGVPRLVHLGLTRADAGREIRQKDLRALSDLDSWVALIVARCSPRIIREDPETGETESILEGGTHEVMSLIDGTRTGSRRAMTDDVKKRVAAVYNAADRYGLDEVEAAFGVSRPTAARYIKAAREAGYIKEKKK